VTLLRPALEALYVSYNADRSVADPVWIVHRYERPDDREVVAFIAAALAFGRAFVAMDDPNRVDNAAVSVVADIKRLQRGPQQCHLPKSW